MGAEGPWCEVPAGKGLRFLTGCLASRFPALGNKARLSRGTGIALLCWKGAFVESAVHTV